MLLVTASLGQLSGGMVLFFHDPRILFVGLFLSLASLCRRSWEPGLVLSGWIPPQPKASCGALQMSSAGLQPKSVGCPFPGLGTHMV